MKHRRIPWPLRPIDDRRRTEIREVLERYQQRTGQPVDADAFIGRLTHAVMMANRAHEALTHDRRVRKTLHGSDRSLKELQALKRRVRATVQALPTIERETRFDCVPLRDALVRTEEHTDSLIVAIKCFKALKSDTGRPVDAPQRILLFLVARACAECGIEPTTYPDGVWVSVSSNLLGNASLDEHLIVAVRKEEARQRRDGGISHAGIVITR